MVNLPETLPLKITMSSTISLQLSVVGNPETFLLYADILTGLTLFNVSPLDK